MAKYKEYKPDVYKESDAVKGALNDFNTLKGQDFKNLQLDDFKNSDQTNNYLKLLNGLKAPGEFSYAKLQGMDDIWNQIQNRSPFTYDVNGDALYQQYKDQHVNQGKMAMMDTMGQAAAMTGGYGSSYGQSVGQQAYQGYLQQLNDVVPELYQMAYDRYNQEGQDLYNQYSLLSSQDQADYGKHRDTVADHNTERDYLANRYDSERNYDYGKYTDDRNFDYSSFIDNRNYDYQVGRDEVADSQWQATFDEGIRQYEQNFGYQKDRDAVADSQWNQSFEYQQGRDQVADSQWQQSFEYQKDRDSVADSQWQTAFEEGIRQFNTSLSEQQRQYNSSLAEDQRQFNENMNFSKQQYEDAKKAASSGGGGGGNSGGGNAALSHVASMSSAEIVETMQGYNADGDNNGLAAFLDDCVASGRLTEAQADNYYSKYRKGTTGAISPTTTTSPNSNITNMLN